MFILAPKTEEKAYEVACNIFRDYYERITGLKLEVKTEASTGEDMVVIGSEAVQPFVYRTMKGGLPVRCHSDDYCLISKEDGERNLLFLAGGRGRSTIYAVYDFFERQAGCHYFWDGDVVPQRKHIEIRGLDVKESPRFTYRAIRYFAHRGLGRFQAEHWDFEEWKAEIDWICKSRLNVFMLRIGIDDLFQKAFPEIVSYPSNEEILPEATTGYNNRTTFWSLQYRGELRKRIMDYAFACDLIHPEDCGTMTHWYSRTPIDFLNKVKPTFLSQTSKAQSEQTGLVWDILEEKNISNYEKLTDTHIKEYGKPEMFHTIGLAERTYHEDRRANLDLKKYAYHKIINYVARKYPNAPLLIAAWDFFFCLKPEEIREITALFHPDEIIIFDYTVDLKAKNNDFENWDIVGKIPWIFGIFHAYEPQNHIHGDYEYLNKKLAIAKEDPFCKGMAFWPELSHSDTLMLEYFRENAWKPQGRSINEIAVQMCHNRYGEHEKVMLEIWDTFLKTMKLPTRARMASFYDILDVNAIFLRMFQLEHVRQPDCEKHWEGFEDYEKSFVPDMKKTLSLIYNLPESVFALPFIHRDTVDMLKTVVMKKMQYACIKLSLSILRWYRGKEEEAQIKILIDYIEKMLDIFGDVLGLHEDHSMYHSLLDLKKNREINPYFEDTLKDNVINWYCRTSAYEAVKGVYQKEFVVFKAWILNKLCVNDRNDVDMSSFAIEKERIFEAFKETPLEAFHKQQKPDYKTVLEKLMSIF